MLQACSCTGLLPVFDGSGSPVMMMLFDGGGVGDDDDSDVMCVLEAPCGGSWRQHRRNNVSDLLRSQGVFYLSFKLNPVSPLLSWKLLQLFI